jgi:hypothetical protein
MPRAFLFVLVVTGLMLSATPAEARGPKGGPQTYSQLKRKLSGKPETRYAKLRRFAEDQRVALGERLKAASAMRRLFGGEDSRTAKALMLEARLQTVAQAPSLRKRALSRAKAAAKTAGSGTIERLVDEAQQADAALALLIKATEARERKGKWEALTSDELALSDAVTDKARAYVPTKDKAQAAWARYWQARLKSTVADERPSALKELAGLVRLGGRSRDLAPVRVAVRRLRANLLAVEKDWEEAAHESLVADRAMSSPPSVAAFDKPEPPDYARTRETSELCYLAFKKGVSCYELEKKRFDGPTFYDFSQEARSGLFNERRSQNVAAEYTPLINDCIAEGAKTGETRDSTIQLEWAIGHDGRIEGFDLYPRRLRGTAFQKCVDEAMKKFRYPPYKGEQKHVGLSWQVGE